MSAQSLSWLRHTQAFLNGADPNLNRLFMHALMHADYPKVALLDAFEAILADFLAGPHRQRLKVQPAADNHEKADADITEWPA